MQKLIDTNEIEITVLSQIEAKRFAAKQGVKWRHSYTEHFAEDSTTFVAFINKEPVGFILSTLSLQEAPLLEGNNFQLFWEPRYIYTEPAYRKNGVAEKLWQPVNLSVINFLKKTAEKAIANKMKIEIHFSREFKSAEGRSTYFKNAKKLYEDFKELELPADLLI